MPNVLIITGDRNSTGKRDFTQAFLPEAKAFAEAIPGNHRVIRIDTSQSMGQRRTQLLDEIRELKDADLEHIAFFCHGWADGIQCGLRKTDCKEFAESVKAVLPPAPWPASRPIHVILYCCLAGSTSDKNISGDGGFADKLRDAFCEAGMTWVKVYAHTTAGHTTRNPYVRIFEGQGSPIGGIGGQLLVQPGAKLWKTWRSALWSQGVYSKKKSRWIRMPESISEVSSSVTLGYGRQKQEAVRARNFRFLAPFMTIQELHNALLNTLVIENGLGVSIKSGRLR